MRAALGRGIALWCFRAVSPRCAAPASPAAPAFVCRHCGQAMTVLQVFLRGTPIRARQRHDFRAR
ncbi:MAG: hypothetical protein MZW92_75185 [Comamonadaceae bacterium]|nr:hypothetical protein [Comamonadaceae bacterium]